MINFNLRDVQLDVEYVANPVNRIIVLSGIACSGKSEYSKKLMSLEHPGLFRVNRDDIRTMLFGLEPHDHADYYKRKDLRYREQDVSVVQEYSIRGLLSSGMSVIVDNTNLRMNYIEGFKRFGYPVEVHLLECDVNTASTRCVERDRVVNEDIIISQAKQMTSLLGELRRLNYIN